VRSYRLGDPVLDARIEALAADAVADGRDHEDADLIAEMMVTALRLHRDQADRGDLKLVNTALKEMRYAFAVFSQYRQIPKVTVFGSARTGHEDANYRLAADFAEHMTDRRRWMVVTGAGPGIMEAANKGAGGDYSFGVNIRLPFEAEANPYVDGSRLINFKYFFTRKLVFVKESDAFALFPGGFGTQDEAYELLTLTQTGKTTLHPIVLMEAPGTGYWEPWIEFVRGTLVAQGMISPDDLALFTLATDVETAAAEITRFYANYHSTRYVGDDLVIRLRHAPSPDAVHHLNEEFGDLLAAGAIEPIAATPDEIEDGDVPDLPRLRLRFDRRSHGRLRLMINELNALV
jgi:uncharacterized protein (TIGR00730 family)